MTLVLDASVVVDLLLHTPRSSVISRVIADPRESLHAPDYMPVECLNVLRRVWRGRERELGDGALDDLADLGIALHRFDDAYLRRTWLLTGSMTAMDAGYVTLCQALDATLVTSDRALARASYRQCESIEILTPMSDR